MREAIIASFLASISTGLGAIPILILRKVSHRVYDVLLGFSAGIMIAAASFNLIIPSLNNGGLAKCVAGLIAGTFFLYLVELMVPHLHKWHPYFKEKPMPLKLKTGMLMAIAITVHNFPEGLAVGVGYVSAKKLGLILALAVAFQNVPEGLIVAAPLRQAGVSRLKCFVLATLSGIAEPIAAFFGIILFGFSKAILPFGLAFAGGAMLYVVFDEIIPECHSHGNEAQATFAAIAGFIALLALNTVFGA
ncbi:MAG: ZIP family metal transporter [Candidatus Omnitrophota bacterium]